MLNAKWCRHGILDSRFCLTLKTPDIFSNTLSWYEVLKYFDALCFRKTMVSLYQYLHHNEISQINVKVHYVCFVEVETAWYVFNCESSYWIKGDIKEKNCSLDWLISYTQNARRVMLQNWEKCETHTYEKSLSLGVSRGQLIIMEECCRSLALTWIFIQNVLRIHSVSYTHLTLPTILLV